MKKDIFFAIAGLPGAILRTQYEDIAPAFFNLFDYAATFQVRYHQAHLGFGIRQRLTKVKLRHTAAMLFHDVNDLFQVIRQRIVVRNRWLCRAGRRRSGLGRVRLLAHSPLRAAPR